MLQDGYGESALDIVYQIDPYKKLDDEAKNFYNLLEV